MYTLHTAWILTAAWERLHKHWRTLHPRQAAWITEAAWERRAVEEDALISVAVWERGVVEEAVWERGVVEEAEIVEAEPGWMEL